MNFKLPESPELKQALEETQRRIKAFQEATRIDKTVTREEPVIFIPAAKPKARKPKDSAGNSTMTLQEVMRDLGVSRDTVYGLCKKKKLTKIGKGLFTKASVDRFLNQK